MTAVVTQEFLVTQWLVLVNRDGFDRHVKYVYNHRYVLVMVQTQSAR